MTYDKEIKEGVRREMERNAEGRLMGFVCEDIERLKCDKCPWFIFQHETIKCYSCARVEDAMERDERALAICFLACEAGVMEEFTQED